MFKGYKTPSPFHLSFITYKSITEKTAERLNNDWNIAELVQVQPQLQIDYPLLFRVVNAASPLTTSYHNQLGAKEWIVPLWSLTSLMVAFEADTLPVIIKSQVIPLFLDMIQVYKTGHPVELFDVNENSLYPLPELLRRSTHQFASSNAVAELFRAVTVEPTESEFEHLVAFYEAFSTNAFIRRLNSTKQFHVKTSYDGKFLQEVIILR